VNSVDLRLDQQHSNPLKLSDCRDAFSRTLEAIAAEDERIVAIVNDSTGSTKLKNFRATFPERFINVGIADRQGDGTDKG
jgi:transketolase